MRSKKAAVELSMSTIVIVVLAMALLIGGIMLVRNILSGANAVVDLTNENVLQEINNMISEGNDIVVKLGSTKTTEVRANGEPSGVVFAAATVDGDIDTTEMTYELSLDTAGRTNCLVTLGQTDTENLFDVTFNEPHEFIQSSQGIASTQLIISIPEGTPFCNQKVLIEVRDGTVLVGQEYFILQIKRGGMF